MNAPAHLRRGACPGLSAPMQTGDGLLARLTPTGTIDLAAFAGLCEAARRFGNGIVEVTSRGSIQVRGLSPASAPLFAAEVAALAIAASDGIPVLADPLVGDDALAAGIRAALAATTLAERLSAKISVTVDCGALPADIAVRSGEEIYLALAETPLGAVPRFHAAEAVRHLLETLVTVASDARMRDAIERRGIAPFQQAISGILLATPAPAPRPATDPIGKHAGALGIGLPFGHSDAATLARLVEAARNAGASGLRAAPGRALLIMDVPPQAAGPLASAAQSLGLITDPADPRRRIVACAGAPICASGEIAARSLAPLVAAANLAGQGTIHISGCIKGCAHPAPAPVTVVGHGGRCDLVVDGASRGTIDPGQLPHRLAAILRGAA